MEKTVSKDKIFPSIAISSQWCMEKNITITGILKSVRNRIPRKMKEGPVRKSKSKKWCYNGKKVLISYADEKKTGTKIVLALTTMFNVMRVSKNQRKKFEPLAYYDHIKGTIDVVNLVSTGASTRTKSKQWTLNANLFLLNTVRTNARNLYDKVNKKNLSSFKFTW